MKILGWLPCSFSASPTSCSRSPANRAVQEPAAHSARPLPCAIRSSVGPPSNLDSSWDRLLTSHTWLRRATLWFRNLPDFEMTSSQLPTLSARIEGWPIKGAFTISRGAKTEAITLVAEISRAGHTGRGECVPYARYGETPEASLAAILSLQNRLREGLTRETLQRALPAGAARNALDCALLDLEAKASGRRAWELLGRAAPRPCTTAFTISLDTVEAMAAATARA